METNAGDTSPIQLSAAEAQAQLGALAQSRAALADRVVTPSWYHPVLAALIAFFVLGQSSQQWSTVSLCIYAAGVVWLITAYRNLTGVWTNGWGAAGGRGHAMGMFVVLLGGVAVAFAVRSGHLDGWWAWAAAAGAGAFTLWVGPRFDAACRAALRGSA